MEILVIVTPMIQVVLRIPSERKLWLKFARLAGFTPRTRLADTSISSERLVRGPRTQPLRQIRLTQEKTSRTPTECPTPRRSNGWDRKKAKRCLADAQEVWLQSRGVNLDSTGVSGTVVSKSESASGSSTLQLVVHPRSILDHGDRPSSVHPRSRGPLGPSSVAGRG